MSPMRPHPIELQATGGGGGASISAGLRYLHAALATPSVVYFSAVPTFFSLALALALALALTLVPIPAIAAPLPAPTTDTAYPGASLSPTDNAASCWIAPPSRAFCLGFFASHAAGRFSAGITFSLDPSPPTPTRAWTAAEASVGPDGALRFRSDGDLVLEDESGAAIWSSGTAGSGVAAARLRDDGNLLLVTANGSVAWQSFDHPSTTLVQNQTLMPGSSLRAGKYTASLLPSGNLTLLYNDTDSATRFTYWSSDTASKSSSAALTNSTFTIFDTNSSTILRRWFSSDYTIPAAQPVIRRVSLDEDGNLRIYSWIVGVSDDWSVGWSAVADQCLVYGFCGPNALCSYGGTDLQQPSCRCAQEAGFLPIDAASDARTGCKSVVSPSSAASSCSMVQINNTLLFIDPQGNSYRYGDAQCSEKCLASSTCAAASALNDGSGSCNWASTSLNYSGYSSPSVPATTFVKLCGSTPPETMTSADGALSKGGGSYDVPLVAALSFAVAVAMMQFVVILWMWRSGKRTRRGGGSRHSAAAGAPMQLTYRELKAATKGFSEKLGEGGFGTVYRGRLRWAAAEEGGGAVAEVAVKRLEAVAEQGEKQFRTEVSVIGSTHHMNLVRLYGFCAEGKHRLLVYEYMKNGSLEKYLFHGEDVAEEEGCTAIKVTPPPLPRTLEWGFRFDILVGAARGITYLHQECRNCIIHCDIKPANILLDDHFGAKVADFGLAKLTGGAGGEGVSAHRRRDSAAAAALRGTRGYLAPEWRSNLPITVKTDVFSFGVVVLETISGRRCFGAAPPLASSPWDQRRPPLSFCEWAYDQYFNRKQTDGVFDGRMKTGGVDLAELDRALKVAFWCLQIQPSARPSMSKVIQMLEGTAAEVGAAHPPPPAPLLSFSEEISEATGDGGGEGSGAATATLSSISCSSAATSFA